MNNRCKELAEQAGIYKLDIGDETAYWVLENFASLIVRECAEVANSGIAPTESHLIGNDILEHFGVEETRSQKMRDAGFTRRPKGWTKDKE